MDNIKILLVSNSPRRKRLLKMLADKFLSIPAFLNEKEEIDKLKFAGKKPEEIAKEIALKKARAKRCKDFRVIIGADTLIDFEGKIIGKPENEEEAESILRELNKKSHKVITAIALIDTQEDKEFSDYAVAEVRIDIPEEVMSDYIKSKNWENKAGAYNIEEFEFARVEVGDRDTVIGLPINILRDLFRKAGLENLIEDKQ
jgi:septum formation protein